MKTKGILTALSLVSTLLLTGLACSKVEAGIKVGQSSPTFSLKDTNGKVHNLSDYKGKYVVLEWLNHGCPFVKNQYDLGNMQSLQKEMTGKDVIWLSVNSSAPGKQGHFKAPKANQLTADKGAAPTAVLLDWDGVVGRKYRARTTPHMFIINPKGLLVYNAAIDNNSSPWKSKADIKKAKNYVRLAMSQAMGGNTRTNPSTKPYGCSVKYK